MEADKTTVYIRNEIESAEDHLRSLKYDVEVAERLLRGTQVWIEKLETALSVHLRDFQFDVFDYLFNDEMDAATFKRLINEPVPADSELEGVQQ